MSPLTIDERTRYQQYALSSAIASEQRENDHARAVSFPRLLAAYLCLDDELAEATGVHEEQARQLTTALSRGQVLANELEEMRIDMLIDVGLCVEERYQDYCGKIINQQFKELAHKMGLPKHTSTTAAAFARYLPASPEPDEEPAPVRPLPL